MFILSFLFFLTATLYSSVGFGGGSTYLALLLIWDIPYLIFPVIALFCNVIVVSGNCFNYIKAGKFDEAIEQLEACNSMGGQRNPGVQNMMFQAVDARFGHAIKAWEDYGAKGDAEFTQASQEISKLEQQRSDYRLLRAKERAVTYSNDPNVHMELAMILWERQEVDEALVEFQQAQGSPRHRKKATLHKGKCFALKDQHDIAIKEFELLISELPDMNKDKLEALYELAASLKQLGKDEADIAKNYIYFRSPIGKALIGKKKKDLVTVIAPSGEKSFEIKEVKYI